MSKVKVMIVEDELLIAKELSMFLEELNYHVTGIHKTGENSINCFRQEFPDLVLMDIELAGDIDGIEAASKLREKFQVPIIFLSSMASDQYIKRAKKVHPENYLLKPARKEQLHISIQNAIEKAYPIEASDFNVVGDERIWIKAKTGRLPLNPGEILRIDSDGSYQTIHMEGGKRHLLTTSMKEIASNLGAFGFLRIHKSHIVNFSKVTKVESAYVFIGEDDFPIGRSYQKSVFDWMNKL